MVPNYHILDDFCLIESINGDLNELVISHFCKQIYDDKDRIVDLAFPIGKNG